MPLYLIGKVAISGAFGVVYMFTAEIFPTKLRTSLLGLCSMVGRLGSMLAPLTPLLVSQSVIFTPKIINLISDELFEIFATVAVWRVGIGGGRTGIPVAGNQRATLACDSQGGGRSGTENVALNFLDPIPSELV